MYYSKACLTVPVVSLEYMFYKEAYFTGLFVLRDISYMRIGFTGGYALEEVMCLVYMLLFFPSHILFALRHAFK